MIHVNRSLALQNLDGDEDLYVTVQNVFFQDTPMQLEILRAAVLKRDHNDVRRQAHKIKGSSLSIGAMILGQYCEVMEQQNKGVLSDNNQSLLKDILDEFAFLQNQQLC